MRLPRGRHLTIAGCLLAVVALLLVEGFTTKTVGAASTSAHDGAGAPLVGQQPILAYRGGQLASDQSAPGRRIALTFDDGPDPTWTPKIAAILRAQRVPATFFEVGSLVVRHPELTRMLYRDGFELGNHTFTHADPATLPGWESSMQIAATESAIAGAAGVRPVLVRPPYSSTPDAVTNRQEQAWARIARAGYRIVLSNYDTEDWSRPGVSTIVSNVVSQLPRDGSGGIVLMHDAGGNRAETVAALPKLIGALRARGYTFARVSDLAGLPPSAVEVPASGLQRLRGRLFDDALALAGWLTRTLTLLVELVTGLVALRMLAGLTLASIQFRRARGHRVEEGFAPSVSVVVPAYNEELGIAGTVESLALCDYPGPLEVIVVDDGSTDRTAELVQSLRLASVRLIRQANAGKAAALNTGIHEAAHELVVTVDGDTIFERDTLALLVQRFRDPAVGAISGNTKIGNRGTLVGRWQHIEYVMGFNLDRRMYEILGATPTVPGAIGAYRRSALLDVGGVSAATLAEDTDLTLELGRAGWNVVYEQRARAWTEAPADLRGLYRQRARWAYGTIQSAWKHRAALWSRGEHGRGRRAVGVLMLFQIALPLTAPLIDLFAIYSLIFLDPFPILLFWGAFNLFQLVLAWTAFGFDRESRRPLWALPLQQFLWRQVMYLVVLDSVISALLGSRQLWRHSTRTGARAVGGTGRATALRIAPAQRRLARRWRVPLRLVAGVALLLIAALAATSLAARAPVTAPRLARTAGTAARPAAVASSSNPFAGQRFFVDHDSDAWWTRQHWLDARRFRDARTLAKLTNNAWAHWFGDWSDGHGSTYGDVSAEVTRETQAGALPVLVAYDIPWRDCGSYSSGGATSATQYAQFIDQFARGIGDRKAVVVLEPDALAELDCLSAAQQNAYYSMLGDAVARLDRNPQTAVYLDAGNAGWQSAATMADRLRRAGVAGARGFTLNVANFDWTASEVRYGAAIVHRLGYGHFVVDTSRNGRGPARGDAWCNPPGRGLGPRPSASTRNPLVDAFFWIKAPGESDGSCGRGAPVAGNWWPKYGLMLARNAAF